MYVLTLSSPKGKNFKPSIRFFFCFLVFAKLDKAMPIGKDKSGGTQRRNVILHEGDPKARSIETNVQIGAKAKESAIGI